jgi:hypothetical protein
MFHYARRIGEGTAVAMTSTSKDVMIQWLGVLKGRSRITLNCRKRINYTNQRIWQAFQDCTRGMMQIKIQQILQWGMVSKMVVVTVTIGATVTLTAVED